MKAYLYMYIYSILMCSMLKMSKQTIKEYSLYSVPNVNKQIQLIRKLN